MFRAVKCTYSNIQCFLKGSENDVLLKIFNEAKKMVATLWKPPNHYTLDPTACVHGATERTVNAW